MSKQSLFFLDDDEDEDSDFELTQAIHQLDHQNQISLEKEDPPDTRKRTFDALFASSDEEAQTDEEPDSDDVSEWEDVANVYPPSAPPPAPPSAPESFNITINPDHEATIKEQKRRQRIATLITQKRSRTSVLYLSLVCYMLHARLRNKWLNHPRVQKKLKHLLPESLLKKSFKKLRSYIKLASSNQHYDNSESDKLLIYTLKYLIKWFRLNFKIDSNGIRVLGYGPSINHKDKTRPGNQHQYYPNSVTTNIASVLDLLTVIKNFKHNRDTGAQIFTALLRSMGFEARLCMSLPLLPTTSKYKPQPPLDHDKLARNKDNDLLYPIYWTELINPLDSSEVIVIETICFDKEEDRLVRLKRHMGINELSSSTLFRFSTDIYAPSTSNSFNQMPPMSYVMAFTNRDLVIDVSSRYIRDISYRYFNRLDLRTESGRTAMLVQSLLRLFNKRCEYTHYDNLELDALRNTALINYSIPSTFSGMKQNPNLVTVSTLRYNEVLDPKELPLGTVQISKSKAREPVYFKNAIIVGKSIQQWKFLGRSVIPTELDNAVKTTMGLQPRTIYRKRAFNSNLLNNESELNESKLYSFSQTCPYIKEKIRTTESGEVELPRNKYGNIEIFKLSMIPDDCSWITLSDVEKILRDHRRDPKEYTIQDPVPYVPVVVGFDFKAKLGRAIPVKCGVLILKSQEITAKKVWLSGKMKLHKLDAEFKSLRLLRGWRFFLKSLQIKKRLSEHD